MSPTAKLFGSLVVAGLASVTSTAHAQSYLEMAGGIIQQGQADQAAFMDAYYRSLQAEQEIYARAMADPQVRARYRDYRAAGGTASLADYAVYWVRSGGGDPATFRRNTNRTAELNARDRRAIIETSETVSETQREIERARGESSERRSRSTGELLAGHASYTDGDYVYTVPTTLGRGEVARDRQGNLFTVDHNDRYYRWNGWEWESLRHVKR
ncbi:MAG TPA: hypothetical protein PLI18_11435 [Pirellulaceae bacterium]|nr:hypothetical protein [Pirellulaceae bacterium]